MINNTYIAFNLFFQRLFESKLFLLLGMAFLLALVPVALNFVEVVVHYCVL